MKSKKSKADRKEERIQQLEKELAEIKKKAPNTTNVVHFDDSQVEEFLDKLTDRMDWSTNRIIDERYSHPIVISHKKRNYDMFSYLLRVGLSIIFAGFGIVIIATIIKAWNTFWIGGSNNLATLCLLFAGVFCILIGIDICKEKDRNYLISLFSALVALVALIVSLVK